MWAAYVLPFLAGMFAANAVPHLMHGLSGKPFRTPFVRLGGTKVSGPAVNVVWGWANAVVAYLVLGAATPPAIGLAFALGALAIGVALAFIFARDHAG